MEATKTTTFYSKQNGMAATCLIKITSQNLKTLMLGKGVNDIFNISIMSFCSVNHQLFDSSIEDIVLWCKKSYACNIACLFTTYNVNKAGRGDEPLIQAVAFKCIYVI